ncbi:MAG: ATP-dependent helicase [Candidatus Taylorbacteria bacterium]|nr:ATP-dependent helicase [Candidatus Taylorbacteria bacterium]
MSQSFEERYAKLNKAQREAVDSIEGPVMVIAGPGTGKTTILTLRIANILKRTDTPPSGILAITFTEAGVKAMRMKLREVIGPKADEVRIHTFHGFAASLIHEFSDHFPHVSGARQLSDIEAEALVRDILAEKKYAKLRPFGNPDLYVGAILRAIGDSKKEAWTPAMIRSFSKEEAEKVRSDESSLSTRGASKGKLKAEAEKRIEKCERTALFADVYEAYEEGKKAVKAIDFDDLIIEAILAFGRDELLLRLVQERFLYILVDEHQDTNDSQNLLVRLIASFFESPNLFVVGDEKQAIYRFQGASVENFLALKGIWRDVRLISLKDNYRSHQGILDASFSLIERNYGEGEHADLRIELSSGSKEGRKPVEVVMAGNTEALEDRLAEELSRISQRDPLASSAVIVRTNRDVERALSALDARGIKASAERGADIFSHPLGSIYFDLVEYLADPSKHELLSRTLSVGLWRLGFAKSAELIRGLRSGDVASVERSIPGLARLQKAISKAGPIEYLVDAARESGFAELSARDPLSAEIWRGIVALAQDIARKGSISDPRAVIEALLSYRATAESKSVKVSAGRSDSKVSIMTAHGSKGLEYDNVFMPYATEESWMPRGRSSYFILPREKGEGDEIRDARRLFYVAMTRARSRLLILADLSDGVGRDLTPSRFIGEIDPSAVSVSEVPPKKGAPKAAKRDAGAEASELVEYAKRSILEKGISVTALNHFAACPNRFFYRSVLRVPEAPSPSSEKGNAMHEAMSRVWALAEKGEKAIASAIEDSVREYFSRSLLPSYEKDALVDELVASAPKVAKALFSHVSQPGTHLAETWMEIAFRAEVEGDAVECRLHGKLDLVLETDDKVFVFDYKTREAMSEAAIRGETKSDDGGYFRQLAYYKMLVEGNPKYRGKAVEPSLVFIKPDAKGRCPIATVPVSAEDVEGVRGEVLELLKAVWSGKVPGGRCDDPDCDGCRLFEASRA